MVEVTPDDGSRRRLPQWMLGVSFSDHVEANGKQLEEGLASQPCHSEAEILTVRPGKGIGRCEKATLGEGSHVLVKCEAKKRKKKSTEQDEDCEGNAPGKVLEKKGGGRGRRKVQESVAPDRQKVKSKTDEQDAQFDCNVPATFSEKNGCGRRKVQESVAPDRQKVKSKTDEQDAQFDCNVPATFSEKNGCGRRKFQESTVLRRQEAKDSIRGSGEEREVQTSSDYDVELTVEDLVTIAEEYIKADRNAELEEASNRECESGSRLAQRVSSSIKLDDCMDSQNCNERSLIQDATSSKPYGNSASEEITFNSSRTGDPAQDMLNLFLGPWLKKPVEQETRTDIWTHNLAFSYEIETKTHTHVVGEEIAPIAKKKSSLKDKVAMFLD